MRNFKITIEYDGTSYYGWQRQNDEKKMVTVQGVLEKALQRIFNKKISVTASGRTDTGVHAFGQAASFKVNSAPARRGGVNTKIPLQNILRALNTYLPEDIVVKEIKDAPLSFSARFSAKKKWYRYNILNDRLPSVFNRYYMVHYPYKLNVALMKQAGRIIKGRHDFSAIVLGDAKGKIKEVYKLGIKKEGEFIYIDIVGNSFLYKMVRRIVGILIGVGRGKINIEDVKKLISGKKIDSEIQTAPAKGLALMRVYY